MRRFTAVAVMASVLATASATPVAAQTLKEQVNNLFRFGECGEALCRSMPTCTGCTMPRRPRSPAAH
jgi:hypothetical protein